MESDLKPCPLGRASEQRSRRARLVGLAALMVAALASWSAKADDALEVRFFAAGHGDCVLIRVPGGHDILVDAGMAKREWGDHLLERRVLPFFTRHDIDSLDAFVLTHPHYDHLGDPELLRRKAFYPTVMTNVDGAAHLAARKRRLVRAGKGRPLKIRKLWRGDEIRFGKLRLEVLHPPKKAGKKTPDSLWEENNRSLVMRAVYGKIRFLLAGDLGFRGERRLLRAARGKLHAQVLKLGHHGKGSTSARWLRAVQPDYAVATCCDRPYHEGLKRSLRRRLKSHHVKLFRTDKHQDVVFRTDGESLEVRTRVDFSGLGRRHTRWGKRHGLLEDDEASDDERAK